MLYMGGKMRDSRRIYYWLVTSDPETGKPYLIFGGDTEEEGRSKGLDMLGSLDFEIRGLCTRNLASASQMVRGKRLEDTHSLHRASQRLGHSKSVKRYLTRGRRLECY